MKMSRATKLIVIVVCGLLIVVISAVAIAQGFPPPAPANVPVGTGFYGGSSGPLPMPHAPTQPVMQAHGEYLFILMGDVLYKVSMNSLTQVGALRLVPPPPPVHPFGGPGAQPPNQPQQD